MTSNNDVCESCGCDWCDDPLCGFGEACAELLEELREQVRKKPLTMKDIMILMANGEEEQLRERETND